MIDIAKRTRCQDCGLDVTAAGHWHMLLDSVWACTGLGPEDGVLCLPCIERRLGRRLAYDDFQRTNRRNREAWDGRSRMIPCVWDRPDERP
jgi:hypothetical protein